MSLEGKLVLITWAARRIGRVIALAIARAGGIPLIHHGHSPLEAEATLAEVKNIGITGYILQADLEDPEQAITLVKTASRLGQLYALINNAAIFEPLTWKSTSLAAWNRHININLTSPFFISQEFARNIPQTENGRIINILDWRALRPGPDHLPYTISKAALAALTRSLASALAPNIIVNGLAFGAILPPSDRSNLTKILDVVPANRWADMNEVEQAILFLLEGPAYITGEILHLDGGRHLV